MLNCQIVQIVKVDCNQIVHGMNRDMSSYFVAKHGVVALTRSLGVAFVFFLSDLRFNFVIKITFDYQRERGTGVEHLAICPAFAETEVTLNTDGTMECLRRNC